MAVSDNNSGDGSASRVVFAARKNVAYQIAVDSILNLGGVSGAGHVALNVAQFSPLSIRMGGLTNGFALTVAGSDRFKASIQTSMHLSNWTTLTLITNLSGVRYLIDPKSSTDFKRFYRTLLR